MTRRHLLRFLRRHEDDLVALAAVAFLVCQLAHAAMS